jgi:hypothetical protein
VAEKQASFDQADGPMAMGENGVMTPFREQRQLARDLAELVDELSGYVLGNPPDLCIRNELLNRAMALTAMVK